MLFWGKARKYSFVIFLLTLACHLLQLHCWSTPSPPFQKPAYLPSSSPPGLMSDTDPIVLPANSVRRGWQNCPSWQEVKRRREEVCGGTGGQLPFYPPEGRNRRAATLSYPEECTVFPEQGKHRQCTRLLRGGQKSAAPRLCPPAGAGTGCCV